MCCDGGVASLISFEHAAMVEWPLSSHTSHLVSTPAWQRVLHAVRTGHLNPEVMRTLNSTIRRPPVRGGDDVCESRGNHLVLARPRVLSIQSLPLPPCCGLSIFRDATSTPPPPTTTNTTNTTHTTNTKLQQQQQQQQNGHHHHYHHHQQQQQHHRRYAPMG